MLTSFFLLVFQGISGGVSGYITNKYAVDMLFKEYTPLKLGGVIKKKKEKFIEEMSELVERDVINSQTLKSQILNKNFNVYAEQIAQTVFQNGLKDNLGSIKIGEVSDFDSTVTKTEIFARKELDSIVPELVKDITANIEIDDIITDTQLSKIARVAYELLAAELEKDTSVSEFIYNIYKENSEITLSNIFSDDIQKKLSENIVKEVSLIMEENMLQNEEQFKLFLDKLLSVSNINLTLVKLQGLIGDYELNQIFNNSDKEEFTLNLFNKINGFINSENGKELVEKLVNDIFLIGKDMHFTIYEILPPEMEESLTEFIRVIIPRIMPYISEWISSNKDNFDEMIEEAIDEAIDDVDESIKKLIISKVRSALMGDVSSKNNIVNKVIDYINNSFDDESYNKLSDSIITYLKNTKIKDMLIILENKNLFNSSKLVEFIIKEFGLHGKKLINTAIKSQFSKKINKLINLDLVKLFSEKLKPIFYKKIFNNRNSIQKKLNELLANFINLKSHEIFNKKLNKLISEDKVQSLSNNIGKVSAEFLKKNNLINETKIKNYMLSEIKNINLQSIVKAYEVDISRFIVDNSIELYRKTVDNYKDCEVKEFIDKNFNEKQLSNIIINKGYPLIVDKLPSLIDGRIKLFVKNSLNKYNEDEICDIVQDFMGNQLKPLSVFGAFLGVIVGVLWQLIYPISTLGNFGFPSSLIDGVVSCGLMAFIGIITNVVALWMIFHPYKENKIASKIPFIKKFAMGYIPAHQKEFALAMAKLIDEQLLNKKEINKAFNLQKHNFQASLTSLVQNNNYQMLLNFTKDKKNAIANYAYGKILKYFDKNSSLSKSISKLLGNIKVSRILKEEHISNISDKLIASIAKLKDYLTTIVENKISSNNKLKDILPKSVVGQIDQYIKSETGKLIEDRIKITEDLSFVRKFIYEQYKDSYDRTITKSFEEILDKGLLENFKNNISEKSCNYIINDLRIQVNNSLRQFLSSGLDENNDIGSMLNGQIKVFVDTNLYSLTNIATKKILNYLQKHQDGIAIEVQQTIKDGLNFFEKIAYASFGGDEIAGRVVEIILNKKLPLMLSSEAEKIVDVAKITLDNSIYPIKISNLKVKIGEFNTEILVDNIFDKLNANTRSKEYIGSGVDLILNSIMRTPIIEYLELCNLSNLEQVYNKFNNEFRIIEDDAYNNIKNNSTELSEYLGEYLNNQLIIRLFNADNSKIFKDITHIDIEKSVDNIINLVSSSEETNKSLNIFMKNFYCNTISKLSVEKFIDMNVLNNSIGNIAKNIFENKQFNEKNVLLIEKAINNAIDNKFDFISDETKAYLTNKTIEIGLHSVSEHIVPMLQEVDLREITIRQMDLLNPKEIDILFNSFAGDLFYKLKLYGVFGFVFGINVWLSIILWMLDWRYSKTSKKDIEMLHNS